jgi:hypothetical protein
VFRSADGERQFRITTTDCSKGAHVHFEAIDPRTGKAIENSHVDLLIGDDNMVVPPARLADVWEDGDEITLTLVRSQEGDNVIVEANSAGYRSLARLMLHMATTMQHGHLHIDRYSGLEMSSDVGLVLTYLTSDDS